MENDALRRLFVTVLSVGNTNKKCYLKFLPVDNMESGDETKAMQVDSLVVEAWFQG